MESATEVTEVWVTDWILSILVHYTDCSQRLPMAGIIPPRVYCEYVKLVDEWN